MISSLYGPHDDVKCARTAASVRTASTDGRGAVLPELQIRASILNLSLQVLDSSGSSELVVGASSEFRTLLLYCLLNYACMHASLLFFGMERLK